MFDLCSQHFSAAKAASSDGHYLFLFLFCAASLSVSHGLDLRTLNAEDRVVLTEIKLVIAHLNVLLAVLLEVILVYVWHDLEPIRE